MKKLNENKIKKIEQEIIEKLRNREKNMKHKKAIENNSFTKDISDKISMNNTPETSSRILKNTQKISFKKSYLREITISVLLFIIIISILKFLNLV